MEAPSPPALTVDVANLSVSRGGTRILHDVSLHLRGGELVALLGPSGCGKSTLLRALTGLLPPSVGQVRIGPGERGNVGYVPQDDIVHLALRVRSALDYAALLRLPANIPEPSRRARVDRVLQVLSLVEHQRKRIGRLSGGQRKRVSVGVELLTDPPLLLMDEPTSGLDPALEEQMMKSLRALTGPGRITLLSTHAMASLDVCDLVVVMAQGRLVFAGPPRAAVAHFGVPDFGAIFRRLAAEPVGSFVTAWERSAWKGRVLARGRVVGRELSA